MEIYRELGGEDGIPGLVTPARRFVDEADCVLHTLPLSAALNPEPVTCFLFNDLLVVARAEGAAGTLHAGRAKSLAHLSLGRRVSGADKPSDGAASGGGLSRIWGGFINVLTKPDAAPAGADARAHSHASASHASTSHASTSHEAAHKSRGRKGSRGGLNLKQQRSFKVLHEMPLDRVDAAVCSGPDAPQFGLALTVKERVPEESSGAGKTQKWKTIINKNVLSFDSHDALEQMREQLHELQRLLLQRERSNEAAVEEHGAKQEKRGWAKKSAGTLSVRVK